MTVERIIQNEDFLTFINNAGKFCNFIETEKSHNYKTFLLSVQKQLISLYTYGQNLPGFDLPNDNGIEEVDITDKDIKDVLLFIGSRLRDPFYWVVFDPTDHEDTASVCGDLVDDLGDIYKDLKKFLVGFTDNNNDVKQNSLWHLKWSFDNHWNDHSINAIYAIHYLLKHAEE